MTRDAILTLNAGSSSIKIGLFEARSLKELAIGLADRIGAEGSFRLKDGNGAVLPVAAVEAGAFRDHAAALNVALGAIDAALPGYRVRAVGHRVVHGGPGFASPVVIDATVMGTLEALQPFAPLHQPHNLAGIRAAIAAFPDSVQVACFDTAFHRTQSFVNDTFGLPRAYYDKGVRRYGFHGLSYEFVAADLLRRAPDLAKGKVIVAHLGNGASMCAIANGRSVTSTMGFTALDGLPMGTRSGQIDPGVVLFLMQSEGMNAAAISDLLYRQSGLLGLSGLSNDMRTLEASDAPAAAEAIAYFTARIRRETGALAAAMGGVDGLVFTAGIGENSSRVRAEVCDGLAWLGVSLDAARNAAAADLISTPDSRVTVMIVPTNEESVIAQATKALASV